MAMQTLLLFPYLMIVIFFHLTVNVYKDSMVTIEVRKDMRSPYAKYAYYNYSHIRICNHVRNTKVLSYFEADSPNQVHFVC